MDWWDPWDDNPAAFTAGWDAAGPFLADPANAGEAQAIHDAQVPDHPRWPLLGRYQRAPYDAGFVLAVYGFVALAR